MMEHDERITCECGADKEYDAPRCPECDGDAPLVTTQGPELRCQESEESPSF